MSIIQDALKKAESSSSPAYVQSKVENVNEVRGLKPAVGQTSRKTVNPPALNRPLLITTGILTFIAVAILLVIQFLSKTDSKPVKTVAVSPQQVSYRPIAKDEANGSSISSSAENLKTTKPPDLVLNGIMYLEEGPRALINNFIVETGESVSGAKVKEINRQNVILEYKNTEITLILK